jgi:predicted metal-dependent hydrolase
VTIAHDGAVTVVAPVRAADRAIEHAFEDARAFIERTRRRLASTPTLGLDRPGVVWRRGQALRVIREVGSPRAEADEAALVLRAPDDAAALRALIRWYRATCLGAVQEHLGALREHLARTPSAVTIRDTRTRFGSCSARGALSFSWRLAVAPDELIRHVVIHEAAHLVHHDHSHRFWDLVATLDPATPQRRAELRRHGGEILGYDASAALRPAAAIRESASIRSACSLGSIARASSRT